MFDRKHTVQLNTSELMPESLRLKFFCAGWISNFNMGNKCEICIVIRTRDDPGIFGWAREAY